MRQVTKKTLNLRGKILSLDQPLVMGILNLTPDSFYPGSRFSPEDEGDYLSRAEAMLRAGAGILDVGGYSTRPGAPEIDSREEIARVIPAIASLRLRIPEAVISIDTFRSEVAEAAVAAGADIINDVSGGNLDEKMFGTVAKLKVPYILMHMRGTPENMNQLTQYESFPADLIKELRQKIARLIDLGVKDIVVDPGFGFSKTPDQNFSLISNLALFQELGHPLLVGVSRKSTISKTLNISTENALNGTTVLHTAALLNGADILRVHDVTEAREAVILTSKLRKAKL